MTIAPAALVITTASAPAGTVGAAYSASFAATGGTSPITWSATGLPAGLTISSGGALTGTPTTPGTSNAAVTARDAAGVTATKTFAITIALPAIAPLNFAGINDTAGAAQQPRLTVALGSPFPVDVVVTLTLTFVADNGGPDDPEIVFAAGGRTARVTIPAGALTGSADVGVQTGTTAGTIVITATLQASGLDVTPSPAPPVGQSASPRLRP